MARPRRNKAAGKALRLDVEGKDAGKALAIERLTLALDTIRVSGSATLPTDPATPLVADAARCGPSAPRERRATPPCRGSTREHAAMHGINRATGGRCTTVLRSLPPPHHAR